jgi:hypothetical protein
MFLVASNKTKGESSMYVRDMPEFAGQPLYPLLQELDEREDAIQELERLEIAKEQVGLDRNGRTVMGIGAIVGLIFGAIGAAFGHMRFMDQYERVLGTARDPGRLQYWAEVLGLGGASGAVTGGPLMLLGTTNPQTQFAYRLPGIHMERMQAKVNQIGRRILILQAEGNPGNADDLYQLNAVRICFENRLTAYHHQIHLTVTHI